MAQLVPPQGRIGYRAIKETIKAKKPGGNFRAFFVWRWEEVEKYFNNWFVSYHLGWLHGDQIDLSILYAVYKTLGQIDIGYDRMKIIQRTGDGECIIPKFGTVGY